MPVDRRALRKIVEGLENIQIDDEILEKNAGLLDTITEGVAKLDVLPIPRETEPFSFVRQYVRTSSERNWIDDQI